MLVRALCGVVALAGVLGTTVSAQAKEIRLYCVMHWKDGSTAKIHDEAFTVDFDTAKVTDADGDPWDAKISDERIEFNQLYKNIRWQIAIDRVTGKISEATYKDGNYDASLDRIGDCSVQTKKF